jgi:uncharacterized membrane protein YtjA (UPF0391 family)
LRHVKCRTYSRFHFAETQSTGDDVMAGWAVMFFIVAIIAAVFGFGGIAGEAAWIGKILLFVFLILAVVSLVLGRKGSASV